jgi:hypothetical protein
MLNHGKLYGIIYKTHSKDCGLGVRKESASTK